MCVYKCDPIMRTHAPACPDNPVPVTRTGEPIDLLAALAQVIGGDAVDRGLEKLQRQDSDVDPLDVDPLDADFYADEQSRRQYGV